jgi:carbonic anhydrase
VLGQTEAVDATATNAQSYFEYTGSFTAAPCTEGVSWVVTKNALAASQDDLETIARILGRAARPLQALNGRAVLDSRVAPA